MRVRWGWAARLGAGLVALASASCSAQSIDVLELRLGLRQSRCASFDGRVTFTLDPSFTANERAELAAGAADARTDGLNVILVTEGGDGELRRGRPDFGPAYGPGQHASFSCDLFTAWMDADVERMREPGALRATTRALLVAFSNAPA